MYMKRAFELAQNADPYPNPKVGAVIVRNGIIIGEGYHKKAGRPHAEIEAINDALAKGEDIKGAIIYVSLEPCSKHGRTPPCTEAIRKYGMKIVYGTRDPNQEHSGQPDAEGPTNQEEGEKLNREYFETWNCFVAIKMAMSIDGKTATRTGDSKWISCEESRKLVRKWRSSYDAVMVGAGTVRTDNPKLSGEGKNPVKIIIGDNVPGDAQCLENAIVVSCENAQKKRGDALICGKNEVDLRLLKRKLAERGLRKILIEGGSELNAKALEYGIVNKIYLFIAPKIIGGKDAKGVIGGKGIDKIANAKSARNMKLSHIGEDILLEFDI
ncbi:bifunctional diaminohydroxyphosphoribosylaminopyrimidine deaminase/5-amino-6-(5-phosphoribosylamino)uracil reductase RibD [Candidatus Micrarchaeota archaeon]|nr:bifunctional diaminohydroxyphosphoribosylaminopyrimidine deaminase/5-amino-6-(5-phosphoribosylamino)uracil reductase RibD [Candidatus Micrarchaeota archaeon]